MRVLGGWVVGGGGTCPGICAVTRMAKLKHTETLTVTRVKAPSRQGVPRLCRKNRDRLAPYGRDQRTNQHHQPTGVKTDCILVLLLLSEKVKGNDDAKISVRVFCSRRAVSPGMTL